MNKSKVHVNYCCTQNFGNHRTEVDQGAALPFADWLTVSYHNQYSWLLGRAMCRYIAHPLHHRRATSDDHSERGKLSDLCLRNGRLHHCLVFRIQYGARQEACLLVGCPCSRRWMVGFPWPRRVNSVALKMSAALFICFCVSA